MSARHCQRVRDGRGEPVDDVRKLTQKVVFFITPQPEGNKFVPPAVRFLWGSFQFDGLMESLEESLEFFSNEGKPLRASMSLNLSQQKITKFIFRATAGHQGLARRRRRARARSRRPRPGRRCKVWPPARARAIAGRALPQPTASRTHACCSQAS